MRIIVTVVEKIVSEAHIDIPDGLNKSAIKQHIVVNTPCGHKYSVVGFANLQGLEISVKEAGTKGRKASALCRKQGIEIERIHDPRFGKVGLYPESVLIEVFSSGQN